MAKVTALFLAVIRNDNATARSDNPEYDAANEEYEKSRAEFIQKRQSELSVSNTLECECCSLPLSSGYHIHHIDGNHSNNDHENFSLRCPFCHYVEHIGFVGVKKMGAIVYAPNISQAHLNILQVIVYSINSAISEMDESSKSYSEMKMLIQKANIVLQSIERTKTIVQRNFQSCDPIHFANIFLSMSDGEYMNREKGAFHGLRVVYDKSHFESEIELWKRDIFQLNSSNQKAQLHPSSWTASAKLFRTQINQLKAV